jgi:hypothetical protein
MKNISRNSKIWISLLSVLLIGGILLAACNIPGIIATPAGDPVENAINTLQAQATLTAAAATSEAPQPTLTATAPNFTDLPTQVVTQVVTQPVVIVTQIVTATPLPTAVPTVVVSTPVPPQPTRIPPTATPIPCNAGEYVADISIPDGTSITADASFVKTWRLKNSGSCTWDTRYDIAFVDGNQMGGPNNIDMPQTVKPGQTVDISLTFKAPSTAGTYTAKYMLVNPNGVKFGLGSTANKSFWVTIKVTGPAPTTGEVYNFANSVCSATWSSGAGVLPCPGKETSVNSGYVLTKSAPVREDGATENEIGLITRPNSSGAIYIMGIYPNFTVKAGDRFVATLMCEGGATKCSVDMGLNYRIGTNGTMTNINVWDQSYDGTWDSVNVDLSAFAGQTLQFILVARNGNSTEDMSALWLNPRIIRQ